MEYHMKTPVPEKEIRRMKMGDLFYVTGTIITARDEAHKRALEMHERGERPPVDFRGVAVFHAGPIMKKAGNGWKVVAVGPTTSARMEIFEDRFIEAFRPAVIIGKGGMGDRTAKACQDFGCVYGAFTGGAALLGARSIKEVKNVFWLEELGMPECLWVYEAEDFGPMIVTIDAHGNNLTKNVGQRVTANKEKMIKSLEG
jgi:tartrate/fumarate subfamily iron-sulfur-dependent hydro-lyase beta chain